MNDDAKTAPSVRHVTRRNGRRLERQYKSFFVHRAPPMARESNWDFSIERLSPLKWVESETTYGVNHLQQRGLNA